MYFNDIILFLYHSSKDGQTSNLDMSLVEDLKNTIDEHNVLAQSFRRVRDYFDQQQTTDVSLRLFRSRTRDARTYNTLTVDEVATLIVGDFDTSDNGRDIVMKKNEGQLQRIYETHFAFIPLQYYILFPFGEDDYQENMPIRTFISKRNRMKTIRVSLREFVAFRIQERQMECGNIVATRRLFQQFLVDAYTMVEAQRIQWVKLNQD